MNFIDTHAHVYTEEFDRDAEAVFERTKAANVGRVYVPAIDSTTHDKMIAVCSRYGYHPMIGLHPCSVKENYNTELKVIEELLKKQTFAGIGETGIDLYWDSTYFQQQKIALQHQINLTLEYDLPIILHTRNATKETIELIESNRNKQLTGIFHCFGGNLEEAKQVIDLGFYLGIGGVVTYKNSGLDQIVKNIPLEHIVLETDSPYLPPVPYRGQRNESSYIPIIAQKIAEIKEMSLEEVARITTLNAEKIFKNYDTALGDV